MGIKIPGVNVSLHSMIWESIYLEGSLVNLKNLQDLFATYIYIYIYIYIYTAIYIFVYLNQWIVYSMVNIQNTGIFFLYSQFNNIEISQAYHSHIIEKNFHTFT